MKEPKAVYGSTKYGGSGSCSTHLFSKLNIPEAARQSLANISNHAIAKKTWSSYKTAERMLDRCRRETEQRLDLPLSNESTLVFLDWLLRVRKVKAGTINTYLAGVRQLHIILGLEEPNLRSGQVTLVMKGLTNLEATEKRRRVYKGRLPVTLALLKMLKHRIRSQKWPTSKKFLVWAVCSIAFHGGFRIHELLARSSTIFDPDFTLLGQDAKIQHCLIDGRQTKCIEIRVKNPKESKAGSIAIIDVFETGGQTCPVKAFEKWEKQHVRVVNKPLFSENEGKPLTGSELNKLLKRLLSDLVDYRKGSITAHSFRSGLASLMAEKGMSDEDIQIAGRWSSRAFERYIKLPRTARARTAMKLRGL
jgi:integrase